jgi:RadC-like JAB domain
VLLAMNNKNRVNGFKVVSAGSLTASLVHPREVWRAALHLCAAAVVFVHNHPSGDPAPCQEDQEITRRLKETGDLLGFACLTMSCLAITTGSSRSVIGGCCSRSRFHKLATLKYCRPHITRAPNRPAPYHTHPPCLALHLAFALAGRFGIVTTYLRRIYLLLITGGLKITRGRGRSTTTEPGTTRPPTKQQGW